MKPSLDNSTETLAGTPVRDVRWISKHNYWEGLVWTDSVGVWIPCYWDADGFCLSHPNYDLRATEKIFKPLLKVTDLTDGQIIRNLGSGNVYIVLHANGYYTVAVNTLTVTNPSEWEVLR